jgi:hypothetical protein
MWFSRIEILAPILIAVMIIRLGITTYEMFNEIEPKKGFLKRLLEKYKNRKNRKDKK